MASGQRGRQSLSRSRSSRWIDPLRGRLRRLSGLETTVGPAAAQQAIEFLERAKVCDGDVAKAATDPDLEPIRELPQVQAASRAINTDTLTFGIAYNPASTLADRAPAGSSTCRERVGSGGAVDPALPTPDTVSGSAGWTAVRRAERVMIGLWVALVLAGLAASGPGGLAMGARFT